MNTLTPQTLIRCILASLLSLLSVAMVKAETINCTVITSLPAVITVQGIYCFDGDLSTSDTTGIAIHIQTNNVTIDFNNFKLGGLGAGAGTGATGVYAQSRKNITLRNANIRGFYQGVEIVDDTPNNAGSGGHIIEDSRFDGNRATAIRVFGAGNSIRRNQILNTGGTTFVSGISFGGPGAEIIDNHVHNTYGSTTGNGIVISADADAAMVLHNRVSETTGGSVSFGIRRSGAAPSGILIQDNQIINAGIAGSTAINYGSLNDCLAVNNTMINFTTYINGCADGGGNVTQN